MSARRPFKVLPGFPEGLYGRVTFETAGTGIRGRSFTTEEAAIAAAEAMTTDDADGCSFAAARVYGPDYEPAVVLEFRSTPEGLPSARRINVITGELS